ncbi:MAG: hypothetical protein QWI36_03205 [Wolbachia endosymbiont of Tyrophagus putrescentiae]|nr:hypothetical protein [Wolbachia endosymbiont of Tyrophagus putrescentiae]
MENEVAGNLNYPLQSGEIVIINDLIELGIPNNYEETKKDPASIAFVKGLGDKLVKKVNGELIKGLNTEFNGIRNNIDSTNKSLEEKTTELHKTLQELQNSLNTNDSNDWDFFLTIVQGNNYILS